MFAIGWDISTTMIGVCMVDVDTETTLKFQCYPIDGSSMVEKYDHAINSIDQFLIDNNVLECHHFVEDRLGNFSAGLTTMQTLMKLAQMNAVVSHHLRKSGTVQHLHPATAKRISGLKVPKGGDKKAEAIRLATSNGGMLVNLTKKGNYVRGTDDMADAYLLALSGARLLSGKATLDEAKKARGDKKEARPRGKSRKT